MTLQALRISLGGCLAMGLWAGLTAPPAFAQSANLDEGEFDCVIEPRSVVKLGSAEEGIIREITVERGDVVRKNDVVARLDAELESLAVAVAKLRAERDVEVEASLARLEFRKREAARAAELYRKSIVSTKLRDEADIEQNLAQYGVRAARMDRSMAQLDLKNAEARLDRRTLRSPVDGVVVEITMSPGEFVHEQSPIMTIARVRPLNVEVYVPIPRYGSIEIGMLGEVMPEEPIGGGYLARVKVVDRVFDTASSTFGVRLALPNPDYRLPAGLKCRIRFLSGEASPDSDIVDNLEYVDAPRDAAAEAEPTAPEGTLGPSAKAQRGSAAQPRPGTVTPKRPRDALVQQIQTVLQRIGYDPGAPDGHMGPLTRSAIDAFQRAQALTIDGQPSQDLLDVLRGEAVRRGVQD